MGTISWFRLFSNSAFIALDLPSFLFTVSLEGLGDFDILALRGQYTSVLFEDIFLSVNMNDRNPFRLGEHALFLDENDDVWLGIYRAN